MSNEHVDAVRRIAEENSRHTVKQVEWIEKGLTNSYPPRVCLTMKEPQNDVALKNLYTGGFLAKFLKEGYVATSVGETQAWFVPLGAGIDIEGY